MLLRECTMQDPDAPMLATAYRDSYRRLRATASRYVHWQDTDDMVQDAFVRALQCQRGFRHEASPLTWLNRIVINICHDERRRGQRRARIAAAVSSAASSPTVRPRTVESIGARAAFGALSADDKTICML